MRINTTNSWMNNLPLHSQNMNGVSAPGGMKYDEVAQQGLGIANVAAATTLSSMGNNKDN